VVAQPVHGDLTRFNQRWANDRVVGVQDWDHAALGDPAIDVAGILTSFGVQAAGDIADHDTLPRASLNRATFHSRWLQRATSTTMNDFGTPGSQTSSSATGRERSNWPAVRNHRS